jgi:cytochrome c-type biogenesis protein
VVWRRIPLPSLVLVTAVALAAAVGVFVLLDGGDDEAAGDDESPELELQETGPLPGSVDEVALVALDGGPTRRLGEFVGERPMVLNFFASWCVPCLEELPAFEAVHDDLGAEVTFVGMANRDEPERARDMVERTGVTFPTFADPESSAINYFGGIAMPTTVFIDAGGEVVEVSSEALSEDELRAKIADHFGIGG